jgi:hypothetical protein
MVDRGSPVVNGAVTYIVSQLNQALKSHHALEEEIVVISNLSENSSLVSDDRMVATLVNIEREAFPSKSNHSPFAYQDKVGRPFRPINLNLYLMFIANFQGEKYQEGLKFISSTIDFFQHNPVFDRRKNQAMPAGIDKLLLEIENLNLLELHNVWTLITGRYMPSILFKVRTVSFEQGIQGLSPQAGTLENAVSGS